MFFLRNYARPSNNVLCLGKRFKLTAKGYNGQQESEQVIQDHTKIYPE